MIALGKALEHYPSLPDCGGPNNTHLPLSPSSQEEGERRRRCLLSLSAPGGGEGRGEVGVLAAL